MNTANAIGVIGGSGLYRMAQLEVVEEAHVDTPFGPPSDSYILGNLAGRPLVFLPRHGRGHTILPSELNFRANIYGFKKLGVQRIMSISAVGSMQEHMQPRHVVLPDQFIDRTRHRADTFFGDGVVAHVGFADPICPHMHRVLKDACEAAGATVWVGGSYLCMEGPQFSTRAESHLYRSWGVSVIGMTNLQEAKLAREAEICYATVAMVTDFDCWHEAEEAVTAEMVMETIQANAETAQRIVAQTATLLPERRECTCGQALSVSLVTQPGDIPPATRKRLDIIIGKYIE